jgi:hypothetical protein
MSNEIINNLNALKISVEERYKKQIGFITNSPNRDELIRGILCDRKVFLEINNILESIVQDDKLTNDEKIIKLKGMCFGVPNE